MRSGARPAALAVASVGAVSFVALAAWLVPWHPVPGGMPAAVPVHEVFTARQVRTGEDVARWLRLWSWASLAVSLGLLAWWGLTARGRRLSARLDDRLPGPWWLRTLLLVAAVSLVVRVVTLPFSIALQQHELDSGLSGQAWSGFARDVAVGELVSLVTSALAVLALVGCARLWTRTWPLVAGAVVGVLVVGGSFVYPVLVEPLFNHFTPLPAGTLRTQVLDLAHREGVDVDRVLVADASRRTTTLNAYVSGFGSSRRVVLYDNLVDDVPPDEVLSVVAHELGHARDDDVAIGTALGVAGGITGIGLLGVLWSAGERRRSWPRLGDPRAVPVVLALVALGGFISAPVQNGISRRLETRADVTALQATHDAATFQRLQRQLALRSKADPTPPAWSQFWYGSHPTVLQRIAIARQLADER